MSTHDLGVVFGLMLVGAFAAGAAVSSWSRKSHARRDAEQINQLIRQARRARAEREKLARLRQRQGEQ